MVTFRSPLVVILTCALLALTLAGCLGDEETAPSGDADAPLQERSDEAEVTDQTGSLRGSVGSDAFEPLGGATVTLVETVGTEDLKETKAAKDGSYTINGIEPGRYTVWASAPGYASNRLPVDIEAGQVAEVKFLLSVVPCDECAFQDVREYVGKITYSASWQLEGPVGCMVAPSPTSTEVKNCSGIRANDATHGEVAIEVPERAETLFSAMVWTPAGKLGEHLQLDLMCKEAPRSSSGAILDTDHPCYFDSPGRSSPLIHRVDKAHWEAGGYNHTGAWATRVFATYGLLGTYDLTKIDVGVAYEQSFTLYTEVWVNQPAPADHLPIPDF